MKIGRPPHNWNGSFTRALTIQKMLAGRVKAERSRRVFRFVAGLDVAFGETGNRCIGGVVLWDRQTGDVMETRIAVDKVRVPYTPGFLSFREVPVLVKVLRKLNIVPDVLMCDGQGIAHPRRFGLACHIGVLTGLVAVGCAKSRLFGDHGPVEEVRGSTAALMAGIERIGTVVRTRTGVKPVFVSVGHRICLSQAERLVLDCCIGFRLPEPIRLAHGLVSSKGRSLRAALQ